MWRQSKYPKLTEYLKNKLPKIANNKKVVNAILKYTDLSRKRVKEELQWGEGQVVEIVQLADFENLDQNTIGYYDDNNPNTLYLDIDMIQTFEATNSPTMGDACIFWVGTTILHEYTHYGDALDGVDYPGEEGDLFEKDAYGQDVTINNALEILLNR